MRVKDITIIMSKVKDYFYDYNFDFDKSTFTFYSIDPKDWTDDWSESEVYITDGLTLDDFKFEFTMDELLKMSVKGFWQFTNNGRQP